MATKDDAVAEGVKAKEAGQEEEKKVKAVGYFKLFRFASTGDIALWSFGILGAAWQGFVQVYMIVFFGDIMDDLMLEDNENTMEMIRWFCYLGVMAFVSGWIMFTCCNMSMESQKQKIRLAYLKAVVHQDVSWFDQHEPGTLPERINNNVEKIANGLGDKAGNLVMDLSMMLTGFTFGFYYWWKMGLLILVLVPFMSAGAAIMGQAMTDLQQENQQWYGKAGACCEEVMRGLRTVISCRGELIECKKYDDLLQKARNGGVIAQTKVGIGMGYMMAVMFGAYGVAFWFGAFLIRDGETKPNGELYMAGDVMKTFFCVMFGGFALGMLGEPAQAIAAATAAGGSLYEVLDSKPSIETLENSDAGTKVEAIKSIAFEDVHFNYPARPDVKVLDGCSLRIEAGQRVALVGESGSGKSTVISMIERFYNTAAGKVLINGEDIRVLSTRSLRSVIGYVGQEPVLFATSVRANIMHGNPQATEEDIAAALKDAQVDFVNSLPKGLETFVGSGGNQFSGGQKQRIALARALVKKPSMLLLDEATSALDNKSEKMVQETLDRLGNLDATKALTTIEIAHRLSTVKKRDVIFVMKKGRVVESGTHDDLMSKNGEYYALVASQESAEKGPSASSAGEGSLPESAAEEANNAGAASAAGESASSPKAEEAAEVLDADAIEKKRQEEILTTYKAPLSRIFGFCKPEWIWLVPGVIGALLFGAKEPVLAFVLFDAISKFYLPPDISPAELWATDSPRHPALEKMYSDVCEQAIHFGYISLACLVGGILQFSSFGMMKEGLTMRMRSATMKHLLRMEVGYHDDPDHTPSKNVFALEMYAFRAGNMMTAIGGYANVFGALVVGIVMGFILSWRMGLMVFATIPVMAGAQYIGMMMMMAGTGGSSEEMKTAQQVISDSVNSIRTVRSLSAEDTLVSLVGKWSEPVTQRAVKKAVGAGANFGISQGLIFFIFAYAFWGTMWLIENEYNTFMEAMQAMGCILFGAMGMGQAMSMVGNISAAKVACFDLFNLLDRASLINGLEPSGETPSGEISAVGRIEFRDVKFFYPFRPEIQVLKGVSFTIKEGQSVGLCGPSGGGKSTMLALLQRFYDPQEGQILITERQLLLSSVNIAWWRQQMGYIGQEPILFDTTVRENVLYGMTEKVPDDVLERCGEMANLGFLKEQDGWETQVGPKGERLSGGQKQRVAICRALVRDPQIMLLDEATSALDSQSEQIVQEALNKVLVSRTSFTIAHRLSTIQSSDVILTCAEGQILEYGTHSELMAKGGVYKKLQEASHE